MFIELKSLRRGFSHSQIHCPAHDSNFILFMPRWGIAHFKRECPHRGWKFPRFYSNPMLGMDLVSMPQEGVVIFELILAFPLFVFVNEFKSSEFN